ncbi:MAG: DNA polymerase, partial [Aeromonas veronii]
KAAGLLYQANAADLHKYGLIKVDRLIREQKMDARLMMSCHDEIGVSMREDDEMRRLIVKEYTDFGPGSDTVEMKVPITASGDFGVNWYEASKG